MSSVKITRTTGFSKIVATASAMGKPSVVVGIVDNPDIAEYATYNEFGWAQRVTGKQSTFLQKAFGVDVQIGSVLMSPPRPFMRATFEAKNGEWRQTLRNALKKTGLTDPAQALELVGRQAQVDIQETIRNGGVGGHKFPERSPLTLAIYESQDRETASGRKRRIESGTGSTRKEPLFRSGKLLGAIGYEVREK